MKTVSHLLAGLAALPLLVALSFGSVSAQSNLGKTIVEKLSAKVTALEKACAGDIKKYCRTVTPGEGRMIYCMLPTLLAVGGDTEVKDKLAKGYKVGDMTYKVHLDGDNLVPYLTGQSAKSPRESFLYINDDQQLTGLRYDNWKFVFMFYRLAERPTRISDR